MNDLERILQRLAELESKIDRLESIPKIQLTYPVGYPEACFNGQPHKFPAIWHGITNPPCEVCGYSYPTTYITSDVAF